MTCYVEARSFSAATMVEVHRKASHLGRFRLGARQTSCWAACKVLVDPLHHRRRAGVDLTLEAYAADLDLVCGILAGL